MNGSYHDSYRSNRDDNDLPPVGSKVCLVGLRNQSLNECEGYIENYSRDGDRVIVALIEGPQDIVKVKPKQIEVIEEGPPQMGNDRRGGGGGRPGLTRGHSSRRNNGFNKSSSSNNNMRRVGNGNFNASSQSLVPDDSQELMETLRR